MIRNCFLSRAGFRLPGLSLALCASLAAGAAGAQSQPPQSTSSEDSTVVRVTLAEARALAVAQNPDLLVARQLPEIARGELQQARTIRFNPDLNVIARRDPELTLMQEIEWAGQRGLRAAAARSVLAGAHFESANVGRLTLADVSIAYHRALAAAERQRVVEQLFSLTDRLMGAVRIQLREGEISVLDANLAEIENGRVLARAASARRELVARELDLKLLLGLAPDVALRLQDDADSMAASVALNGDSLVAVALRERPDVGAAVAASEAARSRTALSRREILPNLRVGIVAEPGNSDQGIGLSLGLSLPVLNRGRGTIAARAAEARQSELRRSAVQALVLSEVASAIAAVRGATEELRRYEESVLQPARSNAALLGEAYRAGKIPLTSLLLLRNQLLDAEFGYWAAWLARREAVVLLEAATGTITPADAAGVAGRTHPSR